MPRIYSTLQIESNENLANAGTTQGFSIKPKAQPLSGPVQRLISDQLTRFQTVLRVAWEQMAGTVNGELTFGDGVNNDNMGGYWANVISPGTPNTDFTITHNLGRVPAGYQVFAKAATADVFTGSVPATTSTITLQCTVASVPLRIFVT